MNLRKQKYWIFFLVLMSAVLLAGAAWYEKMQKDTDSLMQLLNKEMTLSIDAVVTENTVEIHIVPYHAVNSKVEINYVMNDVIDNEDAKQVYSEPLVIEKKDYVQAVTIQAEAIVEGRRMTQANRTVFVDAKQLSAGYRYNSYVFSIQIDENELYNEKTGLFVKGENYNGHYTSANFAQKGEQWERLAYLEVYDSNLNLLSAQDVLLQVQGKASSQFSLKSLKFSAIDEKDEKISLDFPEDLNQYHSYFTLNQHEHLIVSNGGNDYLNRMNLIRYGVLKEFAEKSGFLVAQSSIATVYINGSYYGLMELREDFSKSMIASKTGADADMIEILGDSEQQCAELGGYAALLNKNLNDSENRLQLEQIIDVNAFLDYYAFEMLCCNMDWPQNNYRIYRNTEKENDLYRPILFDLDCTFGLDPSMGAEYDGESFKMLIESQESVLLNALLSVEEYKNRFINSFCDLLNVSFTKENIDAVFSKMHDMIEEDMVFNGQESSIEWVQTIAPHYAGHFFYFKTEVEQRVEKMRDLLETYLKNSCWNQVEVVISAPENNSVILWNQNRLFQGDEDFMGIYYVSSPFEITTSIAENEQFAYWLINGEPVYEKNLNLWKLEDTNRFEVELITEKKEGPLLRIHGYANTSDIDFVELINIGDEDVVLSQYWLSDSNQNMTRCPEMILNSGQRVVIYCENGVHLKDYVLQFNLKYGETLKLLDSRKQCIDQVFVFETDADHNQYYARYQESALYCQQRIPATILE